MSENKLFFCLKQKTQLSKCRKLYRLRAQSEYIYQYDGIRTHNWLWFEAVQLIANKSKIKAIQTMSEIIFILLDFVRSLFNYFCLASMFV